MKKGKEKNRVALFSDSVALLKMKKNKVITEGEFDHYLREYVKRMMKV